MEKKVAVITGASSGIGNALGKRLAKMGFEIVALSRTNSNDFENFIKCDVGNSESVRAAFKIIGGKFKKIDLLINNAGFGQSGALEILKEDEIRAMFDVNTYGIMFCTNEALKLMGEGSKIVNISSVCALLPLPYRSLYCASKAAVNMLSLGYRMELKCSKIDVCCICPGDVKTNFTKNRAKNFETNERYGDAIKLSTQSIDKREDKRMTVDYVADKIVKKIKGKKTKPVVIIGKKYKLFIFLKAIFPLSWFLAAINRMFNKTKA